MAALVAKDAKQWAKGSQRLKTRSQMILVIASMYAQ
jgi:hypothetical protein